MSYTLKNSTVALNEEYDVIVCGGGPAGCNAAIAAAREGAKTLLLEASGMLGGMATKGLVNAWTPIHDGERIIHAGLTFQIIKEVKESMPHIKHDRWNWVPVNYEKLKVVLDRMVTESGADVLLHSFVTGVEMKDDRNIDVVLVANKSGLTAYRAKVFIDCTGDADLYAWAGKEFMKGDEQGRLQPTTMCFVLTHMNEDQYLYNPNPDQKLRTKYHNMIHEAQKNGYELPDDHFVPQKIAPGTYSFNAGHVYGIDSTDPKSLTYACIQGRKGAWELTRALKDYCPECFSQAIMQQTAPTIGLRESRRIIADYCFTMEDYIKRQSFPDEVLRGKYPIDVHEEEVGMIRNTLEDYEHYGPGESYGVPYRCMCPRDLDNVLVAGRTVCSDRISNGSLRIMPACMCEGEAVGMAAKYASEMDYPNIHKVDTQILRKRLIEEGAYLPKYDTDTF